MNNQTHAYVVNGRFILFGSKEEVNEFALNDFEEYVKLLSIQYAMGKTVVKQKSKKV